MPTELETQAAEAKCTCSNGTVKCEEGIHYIVRGDYELSCGSCLGTGLKYPRLSRGCPPSGTKDHKGRDLPCCHGSGRVPDVTLEKVLEIWESMGHVTIWFSREYDDRGDYFFGLGDGTGLEKGSNQGPTRQEAALAALMARE